MGAPKQKWTPEEEDALRAGVDKHGAGKWRTIQKDPEFVHFLSARSNIDLKDKWRNMSVSASGQGSREKSSRPKTKAITAVPSNGSEVTTCLAGALVALDSPIAINPEPSKTSHDTKPPRYTAMIMEAFSALRDSNGSDISDISKFIEQRYEVPTTFKRLLSSKLRRLIAQDKIEKVQNGYRLKEASFATKTPTPKQKDPVQRLRQPQIPGLSASWDMVEEAAVAAAYKIADAEAKSFLLSESVKEVERITRMVEESETMLQFAQELYERCSKGEIIMLP